MPTFALGDLTPFRGHPPSVYQPHPHPEPPYPALNHARRGSVSHSWSSWAERHLLLPDLMEVSHGSTSRMVLPAVALACMHGDCCRPKCAWPILPRQGKAADREHQWCSCQCSCRPGECRPMPPSRRH